MLVADMLMDDEILVVDGHFVEFSLAGEGTKVNMHAPHPLLGLIV